MVSGLEGGDLDVIAGRGTDIHKIGRFLCALLKKPGLSCIPPILSAINQSFLNSIE